MPYSQEFSGAVSPRPLGGGPFVLLDDASAGGKGGGAGVRARLYTDPQAVVVARRPEEVAGALARLDALSAQGFWLAGYIAYEAGLALEERLAPLAAARCAASR